MFDFLSIFKFLHMPLFMAAFPSDLARTKNWGTETLTDADMEGQYDLIITWVMAALNATTGHDHSAVANKSPKIDVATGLKVTAQAQGDVLYAVSAAAFARLGAGTKGKCFTTGGAAANPSWEGMTTEGDIEYHDGTSRARLAKGTTLQLLRMNVGATAPEWTPPTFFNDVASTQVYNGNAPGAYTDLDLSAVVGANACLVLLKVKANGASGNQFRFRANGESGTFDTAQYNGGCSTTYIGASKVAYVMLKTDASGIVEWIGGAAENTLITVEGYIK